MLKLTILLLSIIPLTYLAAETCSRVATINYQEVLVDVSSTNRGEGLRYYLEKDEISKSLLDEYQEKNRPTWRSAALSTLGSTMILAGILRSSEGEKENITSRTSLIFGGAGLIAVSYLISKTIQYNNEYLLLKSVEEYNKRNTPQIYLSPTPNQRGVSLGIGIGQEF